MDIQRIISFKNKLLLLIDSIINTKKERLNSIILGDTVFLDSRFIFNYIGLFII